MLAITTVWVSFEFKPPAGGRRVPAEKKKKIDNLLKWWNHTEINLALYYLIIKKIVA